jgi:hypothetical protein
MEIPNTIDEDEYRDNIDHQIREYFKSLGYEVIHLPANRNEKPYSYDVLFGNGTKIFGLQFKRPHKNKNVWWEIDKDQYDILQKNCHIFYCLPEFIDRNLLPQTIHHSLFSKIDGLNFNNQNTKRIYSKDFYWTRWGTFADRIRKCTYGKKIKEDDDSKIVFKLIQFVREKYTSIFSINITTKKIILLDERILYQYF